MSARRACVLAVPALVAGLLALPATAGPATVPVAAPAAARLAAPPGAVSLELGRDGAVRTARGPLGALLDDRREPGLDGLLRATADAVRATGGPSSAQTALVVSAEAPPAPLFAAATGSSAGDLDGDGREDVVTYELEDDALVLVALRGVDGARLWSRPLSADGGLVFPAGTDLTGDGADDLLLDAWTGVGSYAETDDGYRYEEEFTQVYGVVSGADGASVWTRTTDGSYVESWTSSGDPVGLTSSGEGGGELEGLVLPLLSPDVTGDGAGDVVVSELSLTWSESHSSLRPPVAEASRSTSTLRSATRGLVVDGATGTATERRASSGLAGVSYLVPVGDLDGAGSGDLLWANEVVDDHEARCVEVGLVGARECDAEQSAPEVVLERLDGRTGAQVWESRHDGWTAYAYPLGLDADGDGTGDLALEPDGIGRLVVLSGATGEALWQRGDDPDDPYAYLTAVERRGERAVAVFTGFEVTGTAGPGVEPPAPAPLALEAETVVERVDARTGEVLSTERRPVPVPSPSPGDDGWTTLWFYALALGDGDGDGGRELLVGTVASTGNGDDPATQARSTARVSSLLDGTALLEETSDDARQLLPAGDLDGDGLDEVLRDVVTPQGDDPHGTDATAFRLRDGGVLWRFAGSFWELPSPAGDQDGQPGQELLRTRVDDDGAELQSLRGDDLGVRWSRPATLFAVVVVEADGSTSG